LAISTFTIVIAHPSSVPAGPLSSKLEENAMATVKGLSTTSYAILGLLSLRSWTTYELAEQMQRALGQFWPRAVSGLYEEPKKLVAAGLALARPDDVGRRPRTRYEITAEGRRALADWVPTSGSGPVVEFEQLVKIFFAEQATKADLVAAIAGVRAELEERVAATAHVPHEYLEHRGGYPERLPWLILVGKFIDEFEQAIDRWTTWAAAVVADWPDNITEAEPDWEALEEMAGSIDRIAGRAAG
jgi:PadR family transcriptional regulator, regulatory protein AphA